jgi:hypothetical protein
MIDAHRERQWMPSWALALLGGNGVAGLAILLFAPPEGRIAGLAMVSATLLVILFLGIMVTEVGPDEVTVRFGFLPVYRKRIPYEGMAALTPCRYSPLREFGGWGIRGLGKSRALSARGDLGLRISMRDGREWLIGSEDPVALARAIHEAMRTRAA